MLDPKLDYLQQPLDGPDPSPALVSEIETIMARGLTMKQPKGERDTRIKITRETATLITLINKIAPTQKKIEACRKRLRRLNCQLFNEGK